MVDNFGKPFLSAEWRYLAMVNYEIEPAVLMPFVPKGTELDSWNGKTFVSMVGFLFLNTRVVGLSIPFHQNFEEINLRFYVRRKGADGWRRGVVFIKEVVPRVAIAVTARWLYNENYVALPTGNEILRSPDNSAHVESVKYFWPFVTKRISSRWRRAVSRLPLPRDPKKSLSRSIIGGILFKKTVAPSSIASSIRFGVFGKLEVPVSTAMWKNFMASNSRER